MKLLMIVAAVLFLIAVGGLNRAARMETERERQWLEFSIEHHCVVAIPPSFRDESTIWQCDGFQVVR